MLIRQVSEDVIFVLRDLIWVHDHLQGFFCDSLLFVLVIYSGKVPSIEPHLRKQGCLSCAVAEVIDVPSSAWDIAKCLEQKLVSQSHLINYIFIIASSFIVHRPASVREGELAAFDQLSYSLLGIVVLLVPPLPEKCHLDIGEGVILVLLELRHNCIEN